MTKQQKSTNDSHYDTRLALLEQSIEHINETLKEIRLDLRENKSVIKALELKMDTNLKGLELKMDTNLKDLESNLNTRFNAQDNLIKTHFYWTIGAVLGVYGIGITALIAALGKAYGWF